MSDIAEKLLAAAGARSEQADEIHLSSCSLVLGTISGNLNDGCDCGEPGRVRGRCAADRDTVRQCQLMMKLHPRGSEMHMFAWIMLVDRARGYGLEVEQ